MKLETERLWLPCISPETAEAAQAAMVASWPKLTQWMYWTKEGLPTVAQLILRAEEAQRAWEERRAYHCDLLRKDDGVLVGRASIYTVDWSIPKGGIAYWLDSRHAGHGYMTEAVAELTRFALDDLGLARVQIDCDPRNERSAAIPRRLGYNFEGCLKNWSRDLDGNLRDMLVYSQTHRL